jgi:hypothetical protein
MKTKMVIWGSDEKDEKILVALELLNDENKVKIYTFPAPAVTEVFYNQMMNLWRNGGPVSFPENHSVIERELSVSEDLLPDSIRVERTDLINRAKTEWHFVVLSNKLREAYNNEITQFKDKIEQLNGFDEGVWEELKGFWSKVQLQVRDKNLFREHADELRSNTNELFGKLKELRKSLNDEFSKTSKEQANLFMDALRDIEKKVNDGLGLHPIFNELKDLQNKFNSTDFTRSDRSNVWKKLDAAFKLVKEKKFGSSGKDSSSSERVRRRHSGLLSAIKKMENSINRDKKDIEFQNKRINTTEGQLEMQIRQAKLAMIQERIKSKEDKLAEMLRTKEQVEKKLEKEEKKELANKKKQENSQDPSKDKESTKQTSQSGNRSKNEIISIKENPANQTIKPSSISATAKVKSDKEPIPVENAVASETVLSALSNTVGESLEGVFDTVKAAAAVLSDKAEEAIDNLIDNQEEE